MSITVRSNQKVFTEEEVSGLTGICLDHLRALARNKHVGYVARRAQAAAEAAGVAGGQAEHWVFTNYDLMLVAVLQPKCEHKFSTP
jgi:hypothetical protein